MTIKPVPLPARPEALRFEVSAYVDQAFGIAADAAVISIFEGIGDDTANRVDAALREIGPRAVTVKINSGGGDPFAGLTVFNSLRSHGQPITTQILGLAASAASLIAMAGDEIQMAKASQIMIHRASGGAIGSADDMRAMAVALDSVDATMGALYAARTGLTTAEIARLMTAETWMDPERAIALGFADSVMAQNALPKPQKATAAAPQTRQDLQAAFRSLGFSRAEAARMTGAAWTARERGEKAPPSNIDLGRIAAVITAGVTRLQPARRY